MLTNPHLQRIVAAYSSFTGEIRPRGSRCSDSYGRLDLSPWKGLRQSPSLAPRLHTPGRCSTPHFGGHKQSWCCSPATTLPVSALRSPHHPTPFTRDN